MKEVDQFKRENGNVNYTTKELVGGLHTKLDKVIDVVKDIDKRSSRNSVWISAGKYVIGGLGTAIGYLLFIKP